MSRLRALELGDLDMVLRWRNRYEVRSKMFTTHEISAAEHRAWFARLADDPTRSYLLYLDDNTTLGVVGFIDIHRGNQTASWGFYTGDAAPAGTGTRMLSAALDHAFGTLQLARVWAEVLAFNAAGLAVHRKLGFQSEGVLRQHVVGADRVDVHRFGILRSEWPRS